MFEIHIVVWLVFLFLFGASVGSFINVVVYRLPQGLSIIRPSSHCMSCKNPLAWYDNLPIIAWFILKGRCRNCKTGFSIRYPVVELFTALLFVGLFWVYFSGEVRPGLPEFDQGGYLIYGGQIFLVGVLLASSLIDGEHWIIPLSLSYTAVIAGVILSMIVPVFVEMAPDKLWQVTPYANVRTAALAAGAVVGLALAMVLVKFGVIKRSFCEWDEACEEAQKLGKEEPKIQINIRREMVREIAYLTPVILVASIFMWVLTGENSLGERWVVLIIEQKWLAGLLGSVFGFMIGAAVVWGTRILGSLAFGKEAMGLGDVHLMAAVGAMLGWQSPLIAFFLAPFFGLGYALMKMIIQRTREIPYGPFLSMATLIVMVLHDPIIDFFQQALVGTQPLP